MRYDPHPDLALWHPDPDGLLDAVSLAACHVWVQPLPGDPPPHGACGGGGAGPLHPGEQEQQQQRRLRGLCGPFLGCLPVRLGARDGLISCGLDAKAFGHGCKDICVPALCAEYTVAFAVAGPVGRGR